MSLYQNYHKTVAQQWQKQESILKTRILPRQWFIQNVPPGSRVQMYNHSWGYPPIFDLGYHIGSLFLHYPWLKDSSGNFIKTHHPPALLPPLIETIREVCDYIVLNDNHKRQHLGTLQGAKYEPNLKAWKEFYSKIDEVFEKVVFESQYENYRIKSISVYKIY